MRSANLVSGPGFAFILNGGHSFIGGGDYAEAHDHAVWGTLQALLGERGAAWPDARRLVFFF